MILYTGRKVVLTLADGSAVRGKLRWPTVRGCVRLSEAEDLDRDDGNRWIPGVVIVPRARIVIAQVL